MTATIATRPRLVRCECTGATEATWEDHRRCHARWTRGVPVPIRLLDDGVLEVTPKSPIGQRRIAYELGLFFRREGGYDRPPLPYPQPRHQPDEPPWWAYLSITGRRAVGLVVIDRPTATFAWCDGEAECSRVEPGAAWSVSAAFVAVDHRRRGVAAGLVRAAARARGVAVEALAWEPPFTPQGKALAHSLSEPGRILLGQL